MVDGSEYYYQTPAQSGSFIQKVRARHSHMEDVRKPAEPVMTELIDLLLPSSTPFLDTEMEGQETGTEIYLSDPVRYLRTCADGTQGCMVSSNFRWFAYQMSHPVLRENDEVRGWLQKCEEQMYFVFKNSNFYSILPPHFRYALGIGNSVLLRHENQSNGKQVFTCPHPRQSYWLENDNGQTLPYHRLYKKTVSEILQRFSKEKMSKKFNEAVDQGRYYEKFKILHVVYEKTDPIFRDSGIRLNRPYVQMYFEYDAPEEEVPGPILQDGFFTNPVHPWRLEKNDDEVYGRGIGHLALSDIRGANEFEGSVITAVHKEVAQPVVAPMTLRGRLYKDPNGETYLSPAEMRDASQIRELYTRPINYAGVENYQNRKMAGLREWFSVDYFLQLSNMVQQQGTPPTATQILGMADEKAILLIGRIGRFDSDCFDSLMRSIFLTEFIAGRLPPPPAIIYQYGGNMPEVEYLGPLAQAQRRMHSVRNTTNALTSVMPIFEANPESVNKVRWPELVENILEKSGFPQELIVPKPEYDNTIAAIREQQQQLQQVELLEKVAKSLPGLQKETKKNSPLAEIANTV
jgi:hypothetical protein